MGKSVEHLLSCRGLAMAYAGRVVFESVSFDLDRGERLCVIGENGTGKSTLLKGILGLRKPVAGTVSLGQGLMSSQIGYLPQQTKAQSDFPASVSEIVLSGCLNACGTRPFFSRAQRARAIAAMADLGLEGLAKASYRELSGGQQQRVLLARALCATDRLLLLDEPVTGLDPLATMELYQLVSRLSDESGMAVVMVSHDVRGALGIADKVLQLGVGGVTFCGGVASYRKSEAGLAFVGGDRR